MRQASQLCLSSTLPFKRVNRTFIREQQAWTFWIYSKRGSQEPSVICLQSFWVSHSATGTHVCRRPAQEQNISLQYSVFLFLVPFSLAGSNLTLSHPKAPAGIHQQKLFHQNGELDAKYDALMPGIVNILGSQLCRLSSQDWVPEVERENSETKMKKKSSEPLCLLVIYCNRSDPS